MNNIKPKIIIITGPTGSGKTALSLKLAKKINGQIINADSLAIYKYLNIGTAKPNQIELEMVKHHLIDILEPSEHFDAAAYFKSARPIINKLWQNKYIPIVVGGSGLYLRSLIQGLFKGPGRDENIRKNLKKIAAKQGNQYLHQKLLKIDPLAAEKISANDFIRLERALEVYYLSGKAISVWQNEHQLKEKPFDFLTFVLDREPLKLDLILKKRASKMFKQGLLEEVNNILKAGFSADLKPLNSIGYKEAQKCLQGEISKTEAIEHTYIATRQFVKRQRTWLKKQIKIHHWSQKPNFSEILYLSKKHIEQIRN